MKGLLFLKHQSVLITNSLVSMQVQGLEEHFRDSCGGVIKWLDQETHYTAFTEGWGLYAENPLIGEDTTEHIQE